MLIKKKSIRTVERYINSVKSSQAIKLVVKVTPEQRGLVRRAGFSSMPQNGETILPAAVGITSKYNSNGKYLLHYDRPKEDRYITTIEWSWEQWCGKNQTKTVTEYRDIYKKCYQRTFIMPPGIELTWLERNGEFYVTSPCFVVSEIEPDLLKHAINLFLELFGECEIRKDDLTTFAPPNLKRVNWEMLPPGRYPWDKVHNHVQKLVKHKHPRYTNVIMDRQATLTKYEPEEVYTGAGGFRSYMAYVFKSKKLVILESIESDNATYVFGENWQEFSMLTKAEILTNQYQKDRLIHSKGWSGRLQFILDPELQLAI